jgi:hypothetical protein
MTDSLQTMQPDWVKGALTQLQSDAPLPLTLPFLPENANDQPDTDSSSLRGQTTITTEEARVEAIKRLQAMRSAPAPTT